MTAVHQIKVWQPAGFAGLEITELDTTQPVSFKGQLSSFTVGVRFSGVRKTVYRRQSTVTTPDQYIVYQPGEVLNAQPAQGGRYRYKSISLSPALLQRVLFDAGHTRTDHLGFAMFREDPALNRHLQRLYLACHRSFEEGASRLEQQSQLLEVVQQTTAQFAQAGPVASSPGREHWAVRQIERHLQDRLAQDVTLSDLAAVTGLNKWYLIEVFKAHVGITPHQFQMSLRLQRARSLLQSGMMGSQVALEVGFADHSHFIRAFKRHFWMTPRAYQQHFLR